MVAYPAPWPRTSKSILLMYNADVSSQLVLLASFFSTVDEISRRGVDIVADDGTYCRCNGKYLATHKIEIFGL